MHKRRTIRPYEVNARVRVHPCTSYIHRHTLSACLLNLQSDAVTESFARVGSGGGDNAEDGALILRMQGPSLVSAALLCIEGAAAVARELHVLDPVLRVLLRL